MDGQVGDILKTLDQTGKANDTLVLFSSEQGSQFPGCKWTTWDTRLHTALVARWPGKVAKGKRTDAMVQYAGERVSRRAWGEGPRTWTEPLSTPC